MKRPNELVQMDTKGPFYLKASRIKHYFIHTIDDCLRKVVSKWCNRRTTEEGLSVLKEWVKLHGKPMTRCSDALYAADVVKCCALSQSTCMVPLYER